MEADETAKSRYREKGRVMITICGCCNGTGRVECKLLKQVEPQQPPNFRDRLARALSNFESMAPGRLCLIERDYQFADEVIFFLQREGLVGK